MHRKVSKACGMRGLQTLAALIALFQLVAGCGRSAAPAAPGPLLTVIGRPTAPPATASLVIEGQFVLVLQPTRDGDPLVYEPRFLLRETTGISGATIENVAVIDSGGNSDITGPGCWRDKLRVPVGGVLDIFYTDEGQRRLSYCSPGSGGHTETPNLQLAVTFSDDDGRIGTVRAFATVAR